MRVILADTQSKHSGEMRRILLGEGLTCDVDDVVEYEELPGRLAAVQPDLVLVYCNGAQDEALAAIRTAREITDAPILAAGEPAVATVREAMRAGAREFLDLANIREDLSVALINIENEGAVASRRGKIFSLFSPVGGAGVSTAAVNLAVSLAEMHAPDGPGKVALVDLNPAPSDVSLLLDLEPKYTLADVCRQWERLDRKMLAGVMVEHPSGLHVLAQAGYPHEGEMPVNGLNRAAVRQLFVLLRRVYALVVVDLGHALGEEQVEGMRQSNFVGLVVRPDVPALRRVRWALAALAGMGVDRDRFQVILNCYGGRRQIKRAKVEEVLEMRVFRAIPENAAVVTLARNRGVPLTGVSRMAAVSSSYLGFARDVQAFARGVTV